MAEGGPLKTVVSCLADKSAKFCIVIHLGVVSDKITCCNHNSHVGMNYG